MAFTAKREGVKQVPWFSLTEWHQVYKQIYSNDSNEQAKAYDTMLAWKARVPKLPVGVDCTVSIMQVCLRDREWTPKIDNGTLPISYENDLCLMYSTTIMRILNHISNIGNTKQTSLFQIAKQLNIPEWIVHLRHDTAHGYELPSIDVLRIAINILLTWLHEEYWAAEAKGLEDYYTNDFLLKEAQEAEELQVLRDLIEIWTATNLYIHAGYIQVSQIPDVQLRDTLEALRSFALEVLEQNSHTTEQIREKFNEDPIEHIKQDRKYKLQTAQLIIRSELARCLKRKSIVDKEEVFFEALFNTEAFLPTPEILSIFEQPDEETMLKDVLPRSLVTFWEDILYILEERDMIETLVLRLLKLTYKQSESKHTRLVAAMWLNSIFYSYVRLDAAHTIWRALEDGKKKIDPQVLESKVKEKTDTSYPDLRDMLWWGISCTVPHFLTEKAFIFKLVLNPNEFSIKFIPPVLKLIKVCESEVDEQEILQLVDIYTSTTLKGTDEDMNADGCYSVYDLSEKINQFISSSDDDKIAPTKTMPAKNLVDGNIRNTSWKLASENCDWSSSPIGILPWQIDTLEMLQPLDTKLHSKCNASVLASEVTPGFIKSSDLKSRNQINWDNVLRKKKRSKKRYDKESTEVMINKALETAKMQS